MTVQAVIVAAIELFGPVVAGVVVGRLGISPARTRRVAVAGFVLLVALLVDVYLPTIGLWDLLTIVGGGVLGWAVADWPERSLLRGGVAVLLFTGLAVLGGQAILPTPPVFAGESKNGIAYNDQPRFGEVACGLAYPDAEETWAWRYAVGTRDRQGPVDLHLGDSMLVFVPYDDDGNMHGEGRRFPELLDTRDPVADHVNLGTPGVSYDVMLLIARRAMAELPVRRVYVHALLSNDLGELGRPLGCCANQGLFQWEDPALPATCPTPTAPVAWWPALQRLVVRSEPPLWMRTLSHKGATVSYLRLALARWLPVGTPWGGWPDVDDLREPDDTPEIELAWTRTRALLGALRADVASEGAELVVVTMPIGPFLGASPSTARRRVEQMGALAERLGISWWDAWEAFPERPVDRSLFMDDQYHLSFTGHARMADWLGARSGLAGEVLP